MTTTISTQHGEAKVYFDDESDPTNAGYVLRYSNGTQSNLDEILSADDETAAVVEAKAFLTANGIAMTQ